MTALRRAVVRALGPIALKCVGGSLAAGDDFLASRPQGVLRRLARAELIRRYYAARDAETRRLNRERFWGAEAGRQWHAARRSYRQTPEGRAEERRWRAPLLQHLDQLLARHTGLCHVVEVGTGTGEFLVELSERFPTLRAFVGLDLNAVQIAENRAAFAGRRARFEHAEALDWLQSHREPGTVLVAYGTFEYFTQGELDELLRVAAALPPPVAVAVADTVDMDLTAQTDSRPRGELAYSHNFAHRLRQAGFAIVAETRAPVDAGRPEYAQSTVVGLIA